MPKSISIKGLGAGSINVDYDPWDLPPNCISDGINFRVANDKLVAFNGSSIVSTPASNFYAGNLVLSYSELNSFYIALGRSAIKVYNGATWYDISPLGFSEMTVDAELAWTSCQLGVIPIFNNPNLASKAPLYWSPQQSGQLLQSLPFNPTTTWEQQGLSCKVIRSHKNFLFALGLTQMIGGLPTEQPTSFRWSAPASINSIPYTWDELDLASIAGVAQIAGSGGAILDGLTLHDNFIIYSEKAINTVSFTGDQFVWRINNLSSSYGLLATDCVVEVKGIHYFLTEGDILMNDGTTIKSLLSNKLKSRLSSSLSTNHYANSFVIANYAMNEIWFCVVTEGFTLPSVAYIYNFENNSIAIRDLDSKSAGFCYAPTLGAVITWESETRTWAQNLDAWNKNQYSLFGADILGIRPEDSSVVNLESNGGHTLNTRIERTGLQFEESSGIVTVVRIYINAISSGDFYVTIGGQDEASGAVTWSPTILFNPTTQTSLALKARGRYICYKLESHDNIPFSVSSLIFDYENSGAR